MKRFAGKMVSVCLVIVFSICFAITQQSEAGELTKGECRFTFKGERRDGNLYWKGIPILFDLDSIYLITKEAGKSINHWYGWNKRSKTQDNGIDTCTWEGSAEEYGLSYRCKIVLGEKGADFTKEYWFNRDCPARITFHPSILPESVEEQLLGCEYEVETVYGDKYTGLFPEEMPGRWLVVAEHIRSIVIHCRLGDIGIHIPKHSASIATHGKAGSRFNLYINLEGASGNGEKKFPAGYRDTVHIKISFGEKSSSIAFAK